MSTRQRKPAQQPAVPSSSVVPPSVAPVPTVAPTPPSSGAVPGPSALATAEATSPTGAPTKSFVQMKDTEKMTYMANLMASSRATLDRNGVSAHLEEKMASAIPHEINHNERRALLGSVWAKEASALKGQISKVDLKDPKQVAALKKGLSEDRQYLLDKVMDGSLDLSALGGKDKGADKLVKGQITELGIDKRTQQYGEMNDLMRKSSSGTPLTKDEQARLTQLKSIDKGIGMPGKMGDIWGMSSDRFREIYDEGNTRFEQKQYMQLRDHYVTAKKTHDQQQAAHDANPDKVKAPSASIYTSAGIGGFDISPTGQAKLANNYDVLGDMATSYGGSQIMGGYAQSPDFRGHNPGERLAPVLNADGTTFDASIAALKAAGLRQDPTTEDVQLMLGELKMKGIKPGDTTLTNDQFTRKYNGSKPGSDLYQGYMSALSTNEPLYEAAKAKLPAPAPAPTTPGPSPAPKPVAAPQ